MNNALIDSRISVLFAPLRRWDLAFGRTHGEVRRWGEGRRGVLKKIAYIFSLKPHFNEAVDENENLFSLGNRQGDGTHHFVRHAREGKSFLKRTSAMRTELDARQQTGTFRTVSYKGDDLSSGTLKYSQAQFAKNNCFPSVSMHFLGQEFSIKDTRTPDRL
jgi:hypothetical protein